MFATSPTTSATPRAATILRCGVGLGGDRLRYRLGQVQGEIGFVQKISGLDRYRQLNHVRLPRFQDGRFHLILQSRLP